MLFRGKKIMDYTADDIISFIDNKVSESKTLDYKREINFDEKSKTEFIYDISSFYNTDGGCLIIGLDEERDESNKNNGIPKLPGSKINISNYDGIISRLEEIIKQSTNPQITNLEFSQLLEIEGSNIFLIGIPKTNSLPSMVTYSNHNRFFKRKSNGKYTLDTYEIYQTFAQIGDLEDRIYEFIKLRHAIISEGKFWDSISSLHSVIIHTIPLSFFTSKIENFSHENMKQNFIDDIKVPGRESYSYRYCLEGFHLYKNRRLDSPHEIVPYNLIFRNGAIESFTNGPIYEAEIGKPNLYADELLLIIKEQLENNFKFFSKISIDFPVYLSIKLNNSRNLGLINHSGGTLLGRLPYDSLQLPIVLLSNDSLEIKKQIKNMLDILWQSVGINECSLLEFDKVFDTFEIGF